MQHTWSGRCGGINLYPGSALYAPWRLTHCSRAVWGLTVARRPVPSEGDTARPWFRHLQGLPDGGSGSLDPGTVWLRWLQLPFRCQFPAQPARGERWFWAWRERDRPLVHGRAVHREQRQHVRHGQERPGSWGHALLRRLSVHERSRAHHPRARHHHPSVLLHRIPGASARSFGPIESTFLVIDAKPALPSAVQPRAAGGPRFVHRDVPRLVAQ